MAAITICSDFGAPQNIVSHCFHCLPIYFPWSGGTRCHDLSFLNVQLCPTLCNPMDCSTWMFPCPSPTPGVYSNSHPLSRWCHRTIHPLSFPSPPAFNLSQHQGLFQWVSSSHQVVKLLGISASTSVLPMNIQDWYPSGWTGWIFLQSKGLSRVFSNTIVQKHQFFGTQLSL